jgi:nitrite reductase (NADH) small subunit
MTSRGGYTMAMRMVQEVKQSREVEAPGLHADSSDSLEWFVAAPVSAFPRDAGACVKVGTQQIAVFNFARRGEWFACQNLCPHKRQMGLSRGLLGSADDVPKIACPYHKAAFSLQTGECLSADLDSIETYPVRVEDGYVFIGVERD